LIPGAVVCGLLALVGLAWSSSAPPATHGEPAAKEEAPKGEHGATEEAAEAPAEPVYRMGRALNGRFDVSTLRTGTRIDEFRYRLPELRANLPITQRRIAFVRISLVLEFGQETGMAEIQRSEKEILDEIQNRLANCRPRRLLLVEGKLQLKKELITTLNRRLRTAQIRQIYVTDFVIAT
jgi:flagellar basal body-associated protein FliL